MLIMLGIGSLKLIGNSYNEGKTLGIFITLILHYYVPTNI
jgi:hypothetical protein